MFSITKEKIKVDPDFGMNPLCPGDFIVHVEAELGDAGKIKWLDQCGYNALSGVLFTRYGCGDKPADDLSFEPSEEDQALIIEAICEMIERETGLKPREYYDKTAAERLKNINMVKSLVLTSLQIEYKGENVGADKHEIIRHASRIREALEPLYPLSGWDWKAVLNHIETYSPCITKPGYLLEFAYETGDASCDCWRESVVVLDYENVDITALQESISDYMDSDAAEEADGDYRAMTEEIMNASGLDWRFMDGNSVYIRQSYTFKI